MLFSFSSSLSLLLVARLMTGIGVGGEYTAIFAAIDELVPKTLRGRVDIIIDGTWHLGSLLAYLATLYFSRLEGQGWWRIMFLIGPVGAIPLIWLRK